MSIGVAQPIGPGGTGTVDTKVSVSLVTNGPAGTVVYSLPTMENANGPGQVTQMNLASGSNTIAMPPNVAGVAIVLPAGNAVACSHKTVVGDTGTAMAKQGLALLCFDQAPPANLYLVTGGAISGVFLYYF